MKNDENSKKRLVEEVKNLKNQIEHMKSKLDIANKNFERNSTRDPFDTDIEFIGNFDIIKAEGINISDGGICFEIEKPLSFEMRFEVDGKTQDHLAQLIWINNIENEEGEQRTRMGFKFISDEKDSIIPKV